MADNEDKKAHVGETADRPGPMARAQGIHAWFLWGLLIFTLYLAYRVFAPFLHTLILSSLVAALFYPLYVRFVGWFGNRRTPAALAVVVIFVVCVCLPTALFVAGLVGQGVDTLAKVNDWVRHTDFDKLLQQVHLDTALAWLHEKAPFLDLESLDIQGNVLSLSRKTGQMLVGWGGVLLGNMLTLVVHFCFMLFILFFLLKEGGRWIGWVRFLSPLREEQEETILVSLRTVTKSVLMGGLLIAVLQGLTGGMGLAISGIPALFWGTMMGFASLVPVAGTGLIWVPAVAYLALQAKWWTALFLLVWCGVGVTSIDTFLRPYFMSGATGMSTLFIFLSVIGGLQVFGPVGLLYGPLILGLAMVMLRMYGEEYQDFLNPVRCEPRQAPGDDAE